MEISYPLVNYHGHGQSPFLLGKLTIPMVNFNSRLWVYQRVNHHIITISSPITTIFSPFTTILSPFIITDHHKTHHSYHHRISSPRLVFASFFLGAFALSPYLALREYRGTAGAQTGPWFGVEDGLRYLRLHILYTCPWISAVCVCIYIYVYNAHIWYIHTYIYR